MIHSARPIVTPVATIVFCYFVLPDLKSDGRTTCEKTMIPTASDLGLGWVDQYNNLQFKFLEMRNKGHQ